ncbi:hypothetical protein [Actinoplanes derwentensis]|uniref:PH domain-containing protein n=1 Tax=Actinoplanes derwentensis TaxID=113562 RepID=A0A1H2AFM4_9ACTN|nr:hypothetical protein [Actinoplanes derwentensis]GID88248.1 hypothetical protein Ade03nite_71720 [Actinoplanes derwentensis]SDT44639.1 hypothetical protein SAMN04489716_3829 [Actinoplanes derwentensis]
MGRVLGWVVRWRLWLLVGALVASAAFEVGRRVLGHDFGWVVSLVLQVLLPFGLLLVASLTVRDHHPAVLVARAEVPALEVPPNPGMVLLAVAYTLGVHATGALAWDLLMDGDIWWPVGLVTVWLALLALVWRAALGRFGVRLYSEGIVSRELLGSVFIPWEALGGPRPAFAYTPEQVTLTVAEPGRIRKRGLRLGDPAMLPAAGVSAELLARAIHEYANRPELRSAIGTAEELARFQGIPQIAELTARH